MLSPTNVPVSVTLGSDAAHVAGHLLRGGLHGLDDVPVARAAADVALQRRARPRARSGSGSAPAAPSRSSACPACSSRTGARDESVNARCSGVSSPSSRGQVLDRADPRAVGLDGQHHAALHGLAVELDVQAPQLPVSQPMCVPVRSRSSRRKCTSSRRAATSRS